MILDIYLAVMPFAFVTGATYSLFNTERESVLMRVMLALTMGALSGVFWPSTPFLRMMRDS